MTPLTELAVSAYRERFGGDPRAAAFAPGRVEMIGNHTDYNGGYVMSAALDKGTVVAGSPTGDDSITLYAADFGRKAVSSVGTLERDAQNSWASYVLGVVQQLQNRGIKIGGFQAAIRSDLPSGAGLSSSAALEVATALLLQQLFPFELSKMETAQLCQKAENEFVGVSCGLLDQFSSVFGQDDSLLFLDCLTLEHGASKMGRDDLAIVICDSAAKHALTGGDYNTRRAECMAAAAHFGKSLLREVDYDEFQARKGELPDNQRKRAEHILNEDRRVLALREAIRGTDLSRIGRIMTEAHDSCRDLFENTTPELDFLAAVAPTIDGCVGARMTGGGWGGCTLNLVLAEAVPAFSEELKARYLEKTGKDAPVYRSRASVGAHALPL